MMISSPDTSALPPQIAPILQALEARRQKHLGVCHLAALCCGAGGVLACGTSLAASAQAGQMSLWSFLTLPLAFGIYWVIASLEKSKYASHFKRLLLPPLVVQFGELTFESAAGLGEDEFNGAALHARPDRFSSQDLIAGRIGASAIRLSEVEAETGTEGRDSKGRVTTSYQTFFQGLFLVANFQTNLNGTTTILPKELNSPGEKLNERGELVRLKNPEFEAHFQAYSTHPIEARAVLLGDLMRRFLDLKANFGCPISAAFRGQSLYLTIDTGKNWLEAPPLSMPIDATSLRADLNQLQSAFAIVETLDLNPQIRAQEV